MKKNTLLLFSSILFYSCSASGQKIDLAVADKVDVVKTTKHELIPQTQLFFVRPTELVYNKTNNRFEMGENVFITVYTYQNSSISNEIIGFKESVKRFESQGTSPYYIKDLVIGGNKALIMYANSDVAGLESIALVTGNSLNSYVVKGYFPAQNQQIRSEILKSILTTFVDSSIKLEVQYKYTLDLSKSLFKLNEVDGTTHYYTIGGKGDLQKNYVQNQILIQSLPPYPTLEARKRYNDSMMERFKTSLKITGLIENEITINGIKCLESTYTASESNGVSSKNYQIVIGNENETIFITGMAYTNKDITLSQFKELIKTLKLK